MTVCAKCSERPPRHRGYCMRCYNQLHYSGELKPRFIKHGTDRERFEYICPIVDTDECIEWPGNRYAGGYGRHREAQAHRWSHQIFIGPIPDGLVVMHSCDNPPCVNPRHLSAGTVLENTRQAMARGLFRPKEYGRGKKKVAP